MKCKVGKSEPLFNFADIKDTDTVVDLGAWRGQFTSEFSTRAKRVIAVEPLPESCEIIKELNLGNVEIAQLAISDETKAGKLYVHGKTYKNSLYWKIEFSENNVSEVEIETMTWDDLVDKYNIEKVSFCKVNIEGAEEALLKGMTKVFPKKMVIEDHFKNRVTDIYNLQRLLLEKGYIISQYIGTDIYATRNKE